MNIMLKKGVARMDISDISDRIVGTANNISKQADYYVALSEYKMDIRHLNKEIQKLQLLIGRYIYNWFFYNDLNIKEVPRLCREIKQKETEIKKIQGKMASLRKKFSSE